MLLTIHHMWQLGSSHLEWGLPGDLPRGPPVRLPDVVALKGELKMAWNALQEGVSLDNKA